MKGKDKLFHFLNSLLGNSFCLQHLGTIRFSGPTAWSDADAVRNSPVCVYACCNDGAVYGLFGAATR